MFVYFLSESGWEASLCCESVITGYYAHYTVLLVAHNTHRAVSCVQSLAAERLQFPCSNFLLKNSSELEYRFVYCDEEKGGSM